MKLWINLFYFIVFSHTLLATDCPFCNQEIEKQTILETQSLRLIADYAPRVRGHLLIIPKRHVVKAHELLKEEWDEIALLIPKIVKVFEKALNTNQYVILEKNGRNAYQTVPHVHFHLLPIQAQTWHDVFDIDPLILPYEEMENEINFFKFYFKDELVN